MTTAVVNLDQVMELAEADDGRGLCIKCGAEQDGVEADAREYKCHVCDTPTVFGAMELLFMLA